jgi:hypothetical protein
VEIKNSVKTINVVAICIKTQCFTNNCKSSKNVEPIFPKISKQNYSKQTMKTKKNCERVGEEVGGWMSVLYTTYHSQ